MINLITLWERTLTTQQPPDKRQYADGTSQDAINFDEKTVQSSFAFDKEPNIVFVKKINSLEPANDYDDLPLIFLTAEEEEIRLGVVREQLKKNPRFYDGNLMVLTNLFHDDSINTIYLEAKRVPYSFIVALSGRKFAKESHLYQQKYFKVGVLAPLITLDKMTVLLQRTQLGLFSVPGGFLEPGNNKSLNFKSSKTNFVTQTASKEIREEVAGIKGSDRLRFEYTNPTISAVSLRRTQANPIGTIEFIAPAYANCHSTKLAHFLSNNTAVDAHEHTNRFEFVPLDASRSDLLTKKLLESPAMPGAALYLPVALTTARLANQNANMPWPRKVSNSNSLNWRCLFSEQDQRNRYPERIKSDHLSSVACNLYQVNGQF